MSHKPSLLLVEDDPLFVLNLEDLLIDAGYMVFAALHGDAAIAELSSEPERFSCLVTDIRLGTQSDGWAVAQHARAMNPDIAVIYISGRTADWGTVGVSDSVMLQKPFEPDLLTATIVRLTGTAQPSV